MAAEIIVKTCSKCKETKPVSEFWKKGDDRFYSSCKSCNAAQRLGRRERDTELANAWRERNREHVIEYCRARRAAFPEKFRAYRKANPERVKAGKKRWNKANAEKVAEGLRRWRAENPDKVKAIGSRNRARRLGAEGHFTSEDTARIRSAQKDKCACCRIKLNGSGHLDHIIPVSKGGSNWPANLQWLCQPCNNSKKDKPPEEFMRQRGFLL